MERNPMLCRVWHRIWPWQHCFPGTTQHRSKTNDRTCLGSENKWGILPSRVSALQINLILIRDLRRRKRSRSENDKKEKGWNFGLQLLHSGARELGSHLGMSSKTCAFSLWCVEESTSWVGSTAKSDIPTSSITRLRPRVSTHSADSTCPQNGPPSAFIIIESGRRMRTWNCSATLPLTHKDNDKKTCSVLCKSRWNSGFCLQNRADFFCQQVTIGSMRDLTEWFVWLLDVCSCPRGYRTDHFNRERSM